MMCKETDSNRGRRDGSMVKRPCCSCNGMEFSSQNQYGSSRPSVTPVLRDSMLSSDLHRHQVCTWCIHIHADKTSIRIK